MTVQGQSQSSSKLLAYLHLGSYYGQCICWRLAHLQQRVALRWV